MKSILDGVAKPLHNLPLCPEKKLYFPEQTELFKTSIQQTAILYERFI